jgi:hypothetical protein
LAPSAYGTSLRIGEAGMALPFSEICGMTIFFNMINTFALVYNNILTQSLMNKKNQGVCNRVKVNGKIQEYR